MLIAITGIPKLRIYPEMVRESPLLYSCLSKSTTNESAKTSVRIKGENAVNTSIIPSRYPNTRVKT